MANLNRNTRPPRVSIVEKAITREANATAYAAGKALSSSASAPTLAADHTLADPASGIGHGGRLRTLTLTKSHQSTTNADFDVYVFDQPITPLEDLADFDPTDAEMATLVHVERIAAADWRAGAANAGVVKQMDVPFVVGSVNALYFAIVARGNYTPASGEVFTLRAGVVQE